MNHWTVNCLPWPLKRYNHSLRACATTDGGKSQQAKQGFSVVRVGPFQLRPGALHDADAADPVHRCRQNWRQSDCSVSHSIVGNHSGGLAHPYARIEVTDGAGSNGQHEPAGSNHESTDARRLSMDCDTMRQAHARYTSRQGVDCRGKPRHYATNRDPPQGSAISTADLPLRAQKEADNPHHDRVATQASAEHGFVLLEVLVAFVIAALALVVLYNAGLTGLRSTAAAAHYEQAVARARSRLTMAEHASPLIAGNWDGDDGGGYFWHLRVTPIASTTVQPNAALTLARSASFPLTLYAIAVSITWHDADAARVVQLDTEQIGQALR